jgi:hypothetical protein
LRDGGGVGLYEIEIVGESYAIPRGDDGNFVLDIAVKGDESSLG